MTKVEKIRVRFLVEGDEQANKITALLEALGYEAIREIDQDSPQTRLRWAVTRLASSAQLTDREVSILDRVLQGCGNAEIGDELEISKATVKWHMHNIFTKTGAKTREALLREALQLGGVARREPAPSKVDAEPTPASEDDDAR
ncbi:helix-turn-helix domain-containing protein [Enhygromyxa salina]|uniref:Response regulator protein TmoT n=1 Tax=Enhygromyxa salina TaxID=215803 RepID=A0A2S9YWY8_9BACT|nr:helix-turn-helix transcriptional regulator [Enhygromyxa salina]PRQ09593.1 Response regulator protein TmoT [Enhygromyxa salina]